MANVYNVTLRLNGKRKSCIIVIIIIRKQFKELVSYYFSKRHIALSMDATVPDDVSTITIVALRAHWNVN